MGVIRVLHGKNTYESLNKLDALILRHKNDGFEVCTYDFELFHNRINDINIGSYSMFNQKKIYILKRLFSLPKGQIEELLSKLYKSDDDFYIWEDGSIDKRLSIYKELMQKAKVQEYQYLKDSEIRSWIRKILEKEKIEFSDSFLDLLIYQYGQDQWTISNEIKKIIFLLSSEKRSKILKKDLEVLTDTTPDKIWKFVDYFLKGDIEEALVLVDQVVDKSESEFQIIGALASQLRALYLVNSRVSIKQIQDNMHIHPFVLQKIKDLRYIGVDKVKKLYASLLKTEADLKQGLIDAKLALTFLILSI